MEVAQRPPYARSMRRPPSALLVMLCGSALGCYRTARFHTRDVTLLAPLADGRTRSVEIRPLEPAGAEPVRIRPTDEVILRVQTGQADGTRVLHVRPGEMTYSIFGMRFPDRSFVSSQGFTYAPPVRGRFIRNADVAAFELEELDGGATAGAIIGSVLGACATAAAIFLVAMFSSWGDGGPWR